MAKKQKAFSLQLQTGEMENIDQAVKRVPLASKNAMGRTALHIGLKKLLSMSAGDAAQEIQDFNDLDASDRFTK